MPEEFGTEKHLPPADPDGAESRSAPAALPDLEVRLSFELERRLVSLEELGRVIPGYTFSLGVDPAGPVTLRVNGRRWGRGRLVDLGGFWGVQVTDADPDPDIET